MAAAVNWKILKSQELDQSRFETILSKLLRGQLAYHKHRRTSSENFAGETFLPEIICMKNNNKMPEFYRICPNRYFPGFWWAMPPLPRL